MKLVIRIVLGVIVIWALAAGGYWLYQTRAAPAAAPTSFTQIVPVREGSLSNSLSVVGELDSTQSRELAFENMTGAAELEGLVVATGNTVKQGQVLATIDPTSYQQALDQARTDLQAAEKALTELETPATSLEKAQADLAAAKAEYEVQRAKQDLVDLQNPDLSELEDAVVEAQDQLTRLGFDEKLAERDALAKSERDLGYTIDWYQRKINLLTNKDKKNAEEMAELEERQQELPDLQADLVRVQAQRSLAQVSLDTAARTHLSEVAEAQKALNDARAGGDELALAKAQLVIRTAEVALTQAQQDRTTLETGADPTDLAAAQADVDKKRLAVSDAEAALSATELKAPFDGTILETNVRVGNKITASTIIMTIANLDDMQVYAAVDETTIRRITQGQAAQISFDAFPGQSFKGTVLEVPLQGTLQNDVMVYQVPLSLEGAEELPLLVGMTANVDIQTAQADNALLVPTMALQSNRGQYTVMVVNPSDPQGAPVPTPVEVGLSDGMMTQIVQGLKAGDQVVVTVQAATNNTGFGAFPGGGVFFSPANGAFPGGGEDVRAVVEAQAAGPVLDPSIKVGVDRKPKHMKRIIKIVVALAVVGALAAGGYWLYQTRFAPTATSPQSFTQIVPVREGTLSDNVSVVGELDAEQIQDLSFEYLDGSDILKTLDVVAGNTVKQGQVLASIEPAPYQQALDQAKSDLEAAEKALAELGAPATTLEIAQADLAIAQAEYEMQEAYVALAELTSPDIPALQLAVEDARNVLAKSQSDLAVKQNDKTADKELYELQVAEGPLTEDYNRLAAESYSDEFYQDRLRIAFNKMLDAQDERVTFEIQRAKDLFDAEAQARTSQRALTQVEKALSDAQSGGNELDLANANLAVRSAEVALEQAHEDRAALDAGTDPTDLAAAQADVDKKRLAVTDAQTALAGTKLVAPFDGTILETHVSVGDQITDSTVVMTIADLTQLQVFAFVDETTIRRIKEGQTAQISFDAFPGQAFNGQVLAVPLQGTLQNDVMVYQVPVSLQGTENLKLLVGMTANVEVQTAQADNALLVPTMALQRNRGEYMLMLVNPIDPQGAPVPTPVEVGLSDGRFTQIVQGVKAGDQVVVTIQASSTNSPFGTFRTPGGGGVIFMGPAGAAPAGGGRQPGGGGNQRTNP